MKPDRIECILPESALELRTLMGLSQSAFARTYCIPRSTLRGWESQRCKPKPTARSLLTLIAMDPEGAAEVLAR